MKKIFYPWCIIIMLLSTLSGCGKVNNYSDIDASLAPSVITSQPNAENKGYGKFFKANQFEFVSTENGMYEILSIFKGSANIVYTDFASEQTIFLCNRPECQHNDETCSSFVSVDNGYPPIIMATDNNLLLVCPAATESANPYIQTRNLDGTNKQMLTEFNANQQLGMSYFTDNNCLLIDVRETTNDGQTKYLLKEINLKTGETNKTVDLTRKDGFMVLKDSYKNQLVFQYAKPESADTQLYIVNPVDYVFNKEFISYKMGVDFAFVMDDFLFRYIANESKIYRINIETNEEKFVDIPSTPNTISYSISPAYDGKIYYTITSKTTDGNQETKKYIVDIHAGSMSELTLRIPNSNYFVTVTGTYNDTLCVINGFSEKDIVAENQDGQLETFTVYPNEYAFINKADFEKGNPNFREITSNITD